MFLDRQVLGGTTLFDIAPNGGSAVLPGHSFALVVFTDPSVAEEDILIFAEADWIVPGDGATVIYGSELTQLTAASEALFTITKTDPPDEDPPGKDWFAEASQLSDGWRYFDWFKGFKPNGENWIFHGRHGWLFVQGEATSALFLWDVALGRWMFTNETVYPWMYAYGPDEGWVFFFEGGRPGARYFKRGDTAEVVSEQELKVN